MRLAKGVCYLIEDGTPEVAYRVFARLLPDQGAGFLISRQHPNRIRDRLGPKDARIGWLAEAPGEDHFSANAMAHLAKTIQQFIQDHGSSGLVLLDGLEYVIVRNGFLPTLLAFVEHLNEFVMGTQALVLIAFRPETIEPRELALLERNLRVLDGTEVRTQLDTEELGEVLAQREARPRPVESTPKTPKVLRSGPGMSGPRADSVRCANCGTENHDAVAFCVYCGAPLQEKAAELLAPPEPAPRTAPVSAVKPIPPSVRERPPDFVGLIGVAFFLLVVGIVFTLNTNLVNDFRGWWDRVLAGGPFVRPPDGIIAGGVLFFGLLGVANFLTAGLRWVLDRSRFGGLARVLAGAGFFSLAFLLTRYESRSASGQLVVSIWTAVLGTLLIIYIAVGLYWVRARRAVPMGAQAPR